MRVQLNLVVNAKRVEQKNTENIIKRQKNQKNQTKNIVKKEYKKYKLIKLFFDLINYYPNSHIDIRILFNKISAFCSFFLDFVLFKVTKKLSIQLTPSNNDLVL